MISFVLFFLLTILSISQLEFADWLESDITAYSGTYKHFSFNNQQEVFLEELELQQIKDTLLLYYKPIHKSKHSNKITKLSFEVQINENIMIAKHKKSRITGRFVIKYPPSNAKGEVRKGFLWKDKFFVKIQE